MMGHEGGPGRPERATPEQDSRGLPNKIDKGGGELVQAISTVP